MGNTITFYKTGADDECINVKVVSLHRFDSFKELFESKLFPLTGCGDMTADSMYRYYTPEQERKFGVLAIEVRLA